MNMNHTATVNHISFKAPWDLYGYNARVFHSAIRSAGQGVVLEKQDGSKARATSLLGLLSLGIRKGEMVRLFAIDKEQDLSEVLCALEQAAS